MLSYNARVVVFQKRYMVSLREAQWFVNHDMEFMTSKEQNQFNREHCRDEESYNRYLDSIEELGSK